MKGAILGGFFALLLVLASGCASAGTSGGRNSDIITQEELQSVNVNNMYEAVDRLRPRWLRIRSSQSLGTPTMILVYQETNRLGDVSVLRDLGVDAALWLEYMDGARASAMLPGANSQDTEGAIILHTRPRQ